jgi:hypothetical protein
MDLSSVHKRSTRSLVFTAIFFWFFSGCWVVDGLDRLGHDRLAYRWVSSFLFCSVYLGMAIFSTVMLLRRIPSDSTTPQDRPGTSVFSADHSKVR